MRGYQLKIVLKGSHPPIWRRLIVPEDITFFELAHILNEAMGWLDYHLYEIQFRNLGIHIGEYEDDDFGGWQEGDRMEASETYIRDFLDREKHFMYWYDFGDDWEHKVTVEKIIEDYPYDYPQVIKFKGDCPPEDCGGIDGFYEKLEIMNNPEDPYYDDISWWMEEGYREYDMEAINESLKIDNSRELTLRELLGSIPDEDLDNLLETYELRGKAKGNRAQKITTLEKEMLTPKVMASHLSIFGDVHLKAFENVVNKGGSYYPQPDEGYLYLPLAGEGYVGLREDGCICMPADVIEVYNRINTPEFQERRAHTSWLCMCLAVAAELYGVFPVDVLLKLLERGKGLTFDASSVMEYYNNIPASDVVYKKRLALFAGEEYFEDGMYRELLEYQGDTDYYIPTLMELKDYQEQGFFSRNIQIQRLISFLKKTFELDENIASAISGQVQKEISLGGEVEDVFELFDSLELVMTSEKEGEKLVKILVEVWNNTRSVLNRGYTMAEMRGR
ncbi:hypothetical protein M2146_001714 [Lachnospiraceae bacterium PF1-22]|uniref:plasmid pRiA4b ORF-3 family protein n=1 Tax=Ohessyouella blattaphilus TaxID=2949333 RepID=UPI003E29089F